MSPESPKPTPPTSLDAQKPGPVVSSEPQTVSLPSPEPPKPAPISSPELVKPVPPISESQKPVPIPSPEPQKLAPVSPEPVKAALMNPKSQKHSHFQETLGPPSTSSPESPVLAASPEPWGPSPTASPESRKPARTISLSQGSCPHQSLLNLGSHSLLSLQSLETGPSCVTRFLEARDTRVSEVMEIESISIVRALEAC